MSNYASLKATINANIRTNGNEEITGAILNSVLIQMVTSLGEGYIYKGVANPTGNPGTPDQNVFYVTGVAGTYTNYGGVVLPENSIGVIRYNGSWGIDVVHISAIEELTTVMDTMLDVNIGQVLTMADFEYNGIYSTSSMTIGSNNNYKCTRVIDVIPGQVIYYENYPTPPSTANIASLYDANGNPVQYGTYNRVTFYSIVNDGKFTVPAGVYKIGFCWMNRSYPLTSDFRMSVGGNTIELTDYAKDLIRQAVDFTDIAEAIQYNTIIGDIRADYYLKGNSNIVIPANKKLGIITAGQSNAEGRSAYADLPAGFVNPNPNVHYSDNTNGTFTDFQVTQGGSGNDWGFDAITYDALTSPTYGRMDGIYVMKKAVGGTSISKDGGGSKHWTADYEWLSSASASLLRTFESVIRAGIASQGQNFEIQAFLWHQGEGDAGIYEVAKSYYNNLKNMIAYVRGIIGNPRLYMFCGNLSLRNTTDPYVSIINEAYAKLASEDPYLRVIDMSQARLKDQYHFNAAWATYFGQMVYDAMVDVGLVPGGTKINPSQPT